ncbi:hypothetical protein RFI_09962 [Reticulomyxa filosa]|uniref:Uncharacterized protein n=1 Tax=Reticulomyxa filosa TaxID=46433 RepID=X6NP63_RETFI|nr:hypothetical protein RFI_09962 [Reticulomyxa filosa]|eukprot:ETO27162.1 hypothetical protein RFI_09962 [Reticulomyxa filosa]
MPWTYKTSEETVKLEIWDVVDKAIVAELENDSEIPLPHPIANGQPMDASCVDVYKVQFDSANIPNIFTYHNLSGTNAVIFMVDPTQKWTLEYVKNRLPEVNENIDVLILVKSVLCCLQNNFVLLTKSKKSCFKINFEQNSL